MRRARPNLYEGTSPVKRSCSTKRLPMLASSYGDAGEGTVIKDTTPDEPAVMAFDDFEMLCEGCHRVSALWVAQIDRFELHLRSSEPVWLEYRAPNLRTRGRPFGE